MRSRDGDVFSGQTPPTEPDEREGERRDGDDMRVTEAEKAKGMTDYNDLARSRGKDVVREELAPYLGKELEKQAVEQGQEQARQQEQTQVRQQAPSRESEVEGMEM